MNETAKKVLAEQLWHVATVGDDGPNVVPIGFKLVMDDGTLILADVGMVITKANIINNGKIAISACDNESKKSYEVKGTSTYEAEGTTVDMLNKVAEEQQLPFRAKGAVIVKPKQVIATHPGPENNKEVDWD